MFTIALFSVFALASGAVIHHGEDGLGGSGGSHGHGHEHATSYQHVKIENYHPVPVYLKKEHSQLLAHPVAKGHVATSVEVHHGSHQVHHQDPGFAVVSGTHQNLGGHEQLAAGGGYEGLAGGHEQLAAGGGYEGLAGGHEALAAAVSGGHEALAAAAVSGGHDEGAGLGHYAGGAELAGHALEGYGGQEEIAYGHDGGYAQEAAGYAQEGVAYEGGQGHHGHYQ